LPVFFEEGNVSMPNLSDNMYHYNGYCELATIEHLVQVVV